MRLELDMSGSCPAVFPFNDERPSCEWPARAVRFRTHAVTHARHRPPTVVRDLGRRLYSPAFARRRVGAMLAPRNGRKAVPVARPERLPKVDR